jgi:hypothetical protein
MSKTEMWPQYSLKLDNAVIRFVGEYIDSYRMQIEDLQGNILAFESEHSGLQCLVNGINKSLKVPVEEDSRIQAEEGCIRWRFDLTEPAMRIEGEIKAYDSSSVTILYRLKALENISKPHLSWGLKLNVLMPVNRYHFTQSPTQMLYSFADKGLTLSMLSVKDSKQEVSRFHGCQALVAENPDPGSLEFHLRTPPGFVDPAKSDFTLRKGETVELRGFLAIRPGMYYEHVPLNEQVQPLEMQPSRYPYQNYIDMAVENFRDPRKYYEEHEGILYHTAVDGDMKKPRIQYWTEGPGWGGGFDAENAYITILHAQQQKASEKRQDGIKHARKMLDGWLHNPRFRVSEDIFYQQPGDMKEVVIATGWFPDCIWTGAQADFILRLADIYKLTGWEDCLETAIQIGNWVVRHQAPDGSIPTVWQFSIEYPPELGEGWRPYFSRCQRNDKNAEILIDCQPVTACITMLAMYHLHKADPAGNWDKTADKLLNWAVPRLEEKLSEFGNGEFDYLVFRSRSMDPTGIAYIIIGLATAYDHCQDSRLLKLVRRYMETMLAYSANWDCQEHWLRPPEKMTLAPYGADIKLAGGITHGNWMPVYNRGFGGRFNLLMNRNEIAEGMFHAWRVTQDIRYRQHLEAFANWQTYFQFTKEVENSPVTTRGSCPQNHFWTTDFGNCNNDYAVTAHKWVGTYMLLLKNNITGCL